jgi:outer membrane receptor protein involved in Fe transport
VAWDDSTDVVAQHVLSSGVLDPAYPDTGRQVANLPSQQGDVALVATDGAGAIVAWTDGRNGKDVDIYAMQVLEAGTVDVFASATSDIAFLRPSPNPARGALKLRFTLSSAARVSLAIYEVTGRRVREVASGVQPAGQHAYVWDLRDQAGRAVHAGLYFARLEVEGRLLTQKLVTLE